MRNLDELLNALWPLIATIRYIWFVLLIVFLAMLSVSISKIIEYARKKDDAEYKQTKKSIIKSVVINLIVIPVVVSILLGIISGIIAGKFIPQLIENYKDKEGLESLLTAEGAWKSVDYYTATDTQGGLSIAGIWLKLPVKISAQGQIENFNTIKSFLAPYITG